MITPDYPNNVIKDVEQQSADGRRFSIPCNFSFPGMTFDDMEDLRKLVIELGRPERVKQIVNGTRGFKRKYNERTKEYVMNVFRGLED